MSPALLLLPLYLVPLATRNEVLLTILIFTFILSILAVGFNIVFGYAGQLTMFHGAAFGIGGWDRQVAQTGTVFYLCREEACGPGSTVSVRRQSPSADLPSAEGLREGAVARGQAVMLRAESGIVGIETGKPKVTRDKLFRLGEITHCNVCHR